MTVCKIKRNNAEERIKKMSKNNWIVKDSDVISNKSKDSENIDDTIIEPFLNDLEESAKDQIAKLIIRKFKGNRMEFLIESILNAKGYTTYNSQKGGPDKGIDILAAPEPMGFGTPKLCVQVKSTDSQVDRPTLDQLIGSIHNYGADQGLLVSWNGFKSSVEKERPPQFFKVRLWGQKEIISELLSNYDRLNDEIKSEIPLKRVWTLSLSGDE
jgi:restriction system protein